MLSRVESAMMLAEFLHAKQKYDDQDYMYHLIATVHVLNEFGFNEEDDVIAGYLHDSIEDTTATYKLIAKRFGWVVADTVQAVTNEQGKNRKERNLKTYQKLLGNTRALAVKLADRIANVRHSISKGNVSFFEMYKKEYPTLRHYLYTGDAPLESMWLCLDKLFSEEPNVKSNESGNQTTVLQ